MGKDRFPELQAKIYMDENDVKTTTAGNTTALHGDKTFLDEFFYQIDLLRNIIKQISELIRCIQHFQNLILTSQFDTKINKELKKSINDVRTIRNNLKLKIEEMKQTQLLKLNKTTKALLRIQNLQINMLISCSIDTMNQYNEAMLIYREQSKQWIIDRFKMDKNEVEILYQNDSIVSIIELMTENSQNKFSFNNLKTYYRDIIKNEKTMKDLHELLFHKLSVVVKSPDYVIYSTGLYLLERPTEY